MFIPAKLAVLLTAALSVAAMPSHVARNSHYHREIAARVAPVAQIVARDVPVPAKRLVRKKRDGTGRCRPSGNRNVPSSTPKADPKPSSTSSGEPAATPTPEEDPKPTSTSSEEPVATPKEDLTSTSTPSQNQVGNPKENYNPTTPTPTPTPTSTPTSTPASTPNTGTGGATQTGQGTFYDIGLGACGYTNYEPQMVAAVSWQFFDQFTPDGNSNHNTLCGKKLEVTYQGKTFSDIITVDRCGGCATGTDLDFSRAAFDRFDNENVGRLTTIKWRVLE